MSTFWDRQREKQQPAQQPQSRSEVPFWAQGTNILDRLTTVPQQPSQPLPGASEDVSVIDGHDISQATFLRGKSEQCPRCPVNPDTGVRGNLFKPTPSSAMRCFDCGWIEDSRFDSPTAGMSAVTEGTAQRAKQVESGGRDGSKIKLNDSSRVIGRVT